MPEIFPSVEGDGESNLTSDFIGVKLIEYYEALNSLAKNGGYKSISEFEYFDSEMLEDFGVELDEGQSEWHSRDLGVAAIEALINDSSLPKDQALADELAGLLSILRMIPDSSKGWNLQQDI